MRAKKNVITIKDLGYLEINLHICFSVKDFSEKTKRMFSSLI